MDGFLGFFAHYFLIQMGGLGLDRLSLPLLPGEASPDLGLL